MVQPLQRSTVTIPFRQGVDQKQDPLQLDAAYLAFLQNGQFSVLNRIGLRNGGKTISAIDSGAALTTYSGSDAATTATAQELVACDGTSLYSLNGSNGQMIEKGPLASPYVTQRSVMRTNADLTYPGCATDPVTGLQCYATYATGVGLYVTVIDGQTGQPILAPTLIADSTYSPGVRICVFQAQFVVLYTDGTLIWSRTIPLSNATTIGAPFALTAPAGTGALDPVHPWWDAMTNIGTDGVNRLYLAFSSQANTVRIFGFGLYGLISAEFLGTSGQVEATVGCLLTNAPGVTTIGIAYATSGTLFAGQWSYDLTTRTLGPVSTASGAISIAGSQPATGPAVIFAGGGGGAQLNQTVATATVDTATGQFIAITGVLSISPCGQAFTAPNGLVYCLCLFASTIQPSYFLIDQNGKMSGNLCPQTAGLYPNAGYLSQISATNLAQTQFRYGLSQKDLVESANTASPTAGVPLTQIFTQSGLVAVTLDFAAAQFQFLHAELGQSLLWSGGMPYMYDGINVVEHGFPIYPDLLTVSNPGINTDTYNYQYVAIYTWFDDQGLLHRSAPSPVAYQTQNNPIGPSYPVTVVIPTLRLTGKTGVMIELYRTQNGTPEFQRVYNNATDLNSPLNPIINLTDVNTHSYTDTVTDAQINGNPYVYTNGNVLPNYEPGPISSMCVHVNRVFAIASDNPNAIYYSQTAIPGVSPVEFNSLELTLNMDPRGGPSIAVADLVSTAGQLLIVFKESSIFYQAGQGPDSTGSNTDFGLPVLVSPDVGCINPRSVAKIPTGIVFQSLKGIYLLDASLSTTYIGAPVQAALAGQTIVASVVSPNSNTVRFFLSNGSCIKYEWYANAWSFDTLNAVDATAWDGLLTWLTPQGGIAQETVGAWADPGNLPVTMKLQTAWLQFSGVNGWQRLWELELLGTGVTTACPLQVDIAYDGNPAIEQTVIVTPTPVGTYGSAGPYGYGDDNGAYGGAAQQLRWTAYPNRQDCSSVQLTITTLPSATNNALLSLSALGLCFGVRRGKLYPRPANASFGTPQ